MMRAYGAAICADAVTPVALSSGAAGANALKLNVMVMMAQVLSTNKGGCWIVDSLSATPRAVPPLGILAFLPAPSPSTCPFFKLGAGVKLSSYFVVSELPGEGVAVSGYVQ